MPGRSNTRGDCPHCERVGVRLRARGICHKCYSFPEVRCLYPPLVSPTREIKGPGGNRRNKRKPPTPTTALPGTEEKLRALEERAMRDEELWHQEDAVWNGQAAEMGSGNIGLVRLFLPGISAKSKGRGICIHCKFERYLYSRGLCCNCYNNKEVRHLYPTIPKGRHPDNGEGEISGEIEEQDHSQNNEPLSMDQAEEWWENLLGEE